MQTLAELLSKPNLRLPSSEPSQTLLQLWVKHPSTPEVALAVLAALDMPEMVDGSGRRKVGDEWVPIQEENHRRIPALERAVWKYDVAVRCDEIQASRPEGCFCLGGGSLDCDCLEGRAFQAEKERERKVKWSALVERRTEQAEIPLRFQAYTFDNFPGDSKILAAVKAWAIPPEDIEDAWDEWNKDRKESLMLFGPFGTGKTALAVAALKSDIERGGVGMFITVPKLLSRIRASYSDRNAADESEILDRVRSIPMLVLDDLGAERVTDWVQEKLFTIINDRHDEMLTTIFTRNLAPAELGAHIGERTAWRVMEMCEIVKITGRNLRAK